MAKNNPRRDCFAFADNGRYERCNALKEVYCRYEDCKFYKPADPNKKPDWLMPPTGGRTHYKINAERLSQLVGRQRIASIADCSGVGEKTIRRMLRGERVRLRTLTALAKFFEVAIDELIVSE